VDDHGSHGAEPLLFEWRGALFRVRLARLRLAGEQPSHAPARPQLPRLEAPVAASALTIGGTAAFAVGATAGPWPLWVAGMIAVCVSLVLYRP
jgi:hypothetical protein